MAADKLMPCPFCGSEAKGTPGGVVGCEVCDVWLNESWWNRRAPSPGLRERVEAVLVEWETAALADQSDAVARGASKIVCDMAASIRQRALLSSAPEEPEADAAVVERVALNLYLTHYFGPDGFKAYAELPDTEKAEYLWEARRILAIVKRGKA